MFIERKALVLQQWQCEQLCIELQKTTNSIPKPIKKQHCPLLTSCAVKHIQQSM